MNRIISNILAISIIFALLSLIFVGFFGVYLASKAVDSKMRLDCAQISKYEVTNNNTTVSYPVTDVYKKCLLEKGLR